MLLDPTLRSLLLPLTAWVISASLMAVGAAVAAEATAPGAQRSRNLGLIANTLLAAGIWWPGHQTAIARGGEFALLAALAVLGWVTAYVARLGGDRPWHDAKHWQGLAGTLIAALMCISVLHSLEGSGLAWGHGALLALGLLLAVSLRLPYEKVPGRRWAPWYRVAGAAAGAAALCAVAYRTPTTSEPLLEPELLPMGALIALGGFLVTVLRQARRQRLAQAQAQGSGTRTDFDALTGLPNRAALETALAKATVVCDRERRQLALLTLNLDGFKPINATYSHAVGDQLLRQAGARIRRLTKKGDLLARAGGDEFMLLLDDRTAHEELTRLAKRIVDNLARPFRVGTRDVVLSCSIGVALYPDHGEPDKLLARSDAALRAAKRAGGGQIGFYNAEMEADLAENFDLLSDFRHALEHDELKLFYQPKIDATSGKITAAEALLRWHHHQRGEVSPAIFVTLAERFGLVARLGDWVIESACRQARTWADHGLHMRVAINLSAQHMRQPDIAARIKNALLRHHVDPARFTCEITETLAMENTQATQSTFAQLGAAGVHVSIDDFGTGYSSLAYLRSLPASEIKIDRSFVLDLERSGDARAVVDAVIKLAHALGKRVVAEGVETVRQRRILTEMGCDELQGYLFAHPMSAEDLLQWALDARHGDEQAFRSSLFVAAGTDLTADSPPARGFVARTAPLR